MKGIYLNSDAIDARKSGENYRPDRRNFAQIAAKAGAGPTIAKGMLAICDELAAKSKHSFIEGEDTVLWANAISTLVEIDQMDADDRSRLRPAVIAFKNAWHSDAKPTFLRTVIADALAHLPQEPAGIRPARASAYKL